MYISRVAAGGQSGVIAPRPWVIAGGTGNYNRDYQYVWQDDGGYTGSRLSSDYFGQKADYAEVGGVDVMVSHPTDPRLFVASGNVLRIYSPSALESTETVPISGSSYGWITDMRWHDGYLWFAVENKVVYSGTLTLEQEIKGQILAATLSGGIYCSPENSAAIVYAAPSATEPGRVRMIEILQ